MDKDEVIYNDIKGESAMEGTDVTTSKDIAAIAMALSKAQGEMRGAIKDSTNPFFKSQYADLASVMESIRKPFADNELSYTQLMAGDVNSPSVTTILMHSSGQWIKSTVSSTPMKKDIQGQGAVTTYLRRFALSAISGVAQVDDDGNSASEGTPVKLITNEQATEIHVRISEHEIEQGFMKWLKTSLKVSSLDEIQESALPVVTKRIDSAIRAQEKK